MSKEMIIIENISKRAFTIEIEVLDEKKNKKLKSRNLRSGCTVELEKKYAEKLLKSYPLELRDLSKITKASNNAKEIKDKLELSEKQTKTLNEEIKEKNELIAEYEKEVKDKNALITKYEDEIKKLKKSN